MTPDPLRQACDEFIRETFAMKPIDFEVDALLAFAKEQRAAGMRETMNRGNLWSFIRILLSQGGDIMLDYNAGKYTCYEMYSARLDAAARERTDEFIEQRAKELEGVSLHRGPT